MAKKENVGNKVFDMIEQKLLSKEWTTGMKIDSEMKIASDLGVGRSTVRESIDRMVILGILSRKQGGGTFVSHLSSATYLNDLIPIILLDQPNILDVLELREVLETACVNLFVQRHNVKDIELLEETYRVMKDHLNDADGSLYSETDNQFHMIIGKGTKNAMFTKLSDILAKLLLFYQKEVFLRIGVRNSLDEHRKILDAIEVGDSELATLLMKRHIENSRQHTIQAMQNQGSLIEKKP